MTNEQILKKIIEKATKNGYKSIVLFPRDNVWEYYAIIFSHDFAKVFWGEREAPNPLGGGRIKFCDWQHHLQEMILEKEPLKYLEKFIK